jgi:serine/threonine protein kinase
LFTAHIFQSRELVVWKEISLARLTSASQRREVDNEIEILSSLHHVNIVEYLTHYLDANVLYIEMEYVDGRTV